MVCATSGCSPDPPCPVLILGKWNRPSIPWVGDLISPPRRGGPPQPAPPSCSVSGGPRSGAPSAARALRDHRTSPCSQRWKSSRHLPATCNCAFLRPRPDLTQDFTWYFLAVYFISLSRLISHSRIASFVTPVIYHFRRKSVCFLSYLVWCHRKIKSQAPFSILQIFFNMCHVLSSFEGLVTLIPGK